MKSKYILLFTIVLGLSNPALIPQSTDANARVTFDQPEAVTVPLGKSVPVALTFHIKAGYHVNSHQPMTPELIPTEVRFTPPQDLVVAKIQYPAGELTAFAFDPSEKLSVYTGDIAVKAMVLTAPQATAGPYTVHGELKYQACDNSACYPPKRLPIQFEVKIAKGSAASSRAHGNAQSPHVHN
jgi:hypothetical protein